MSDIFSLGFMGSGWWGYGELKLLNQKKMARLKDSQVASTLY